MSDVNLTVTRKLALITGASSGIGLEFARQLAGEGYDLYLCARREEKLATGAREIRNNYGVTVEYWPVDLTLTGAVAAIFAQIKERGRPVHLLVNNAGAACFGPFQSYTWEEHQKIIQLNVVALTELGHLMVRHMKDHGEKSQIVNIASVISYQPIPNYAVYGATKSYVRGFTNSLAQELVGTNIKVTCVSPGGTYTEFMDVANQELTKSARIGMMSPEVVVRKAIRGMGKGRVNVVTGCVNKLMAVLPRFMTENFSLKFFSKLMERMAKMRTGATIGV